MSSNISHRPAAEADAGAMAILCSELGYPVSTEIMRNRIKAVRASCSDLLVVAVDSKGVVAGWLQAHAANIVESGFRVEIMGLIVSPNFRQRGMGRLLVAEVERWGRGIGAEAIVVRSNIKREESHAFYPALGYKCTKTQMVYRKILADVSSEIR